jgi:hypothetical protein
LTVAGQIFTLTQPGVECSLSVSATALSVGATASSGTIAVTANAPDCAWNLVPGASWFTFAGAASRQGSDLVSYNVAKSNTSQPRLTTVTVAGRSIDVTQDAVNCSPSLSASSATPPAIGGALKTTLTTAASDCSWTTASNASWIRVDSGASKTGTNEVALTVSSNAASSKSRTGTVSIAGLTYSVTQAGVSCTSSVAKTTTPSLATATGGTLALAISATPSDCDWSASSDSAWLTTDVSGGSGSYTLTATATPTPSSKPRTANLSIAIGSTTTKVPVTQAGLVCAYTLSSHAAEFDYHAANGVVSVTANAPDCSWTTSRGTTTWITLDSSGSTGSSLVTYKVAANTKTVPQQATLTIAGLSHSVTQGPAPCAVTLASTSGNAAANGVTSTFAVTAVSPECTWTATSEVPWITLTDPLEPAVSVAKLTTQGNASVKFTVAANPSSKARSAAIAVNGKAYTVTQAGTACTYAFAPATIALLPAGGPASVEVTTNLSDCAWAPTTTASWLSFSNADGMGSGSLGVSATPNAGTKSRTASVSVGGKTVNVTQSAQGSSGQSFTRFLAEGATSDFFSTRLALLNPGVTTNNVTVQFLKGTGETVEYKTTVKPTSRLTLDARAIVGNAEFSTAVESSGQLVVDRTMSWNALGYGSHAETGVQFPSESWYLAEGSTAGGFDLFYLVQNPNDAPVKVRVKFLLPGGVTPVERDYSVQPNRRFNIWVDQIPELEKTDVSAVVTADAPIIVERAMYLTRGGVYFLGGHESAGVTAPATEWFLAEGATGPFFDTYVLIANPAATEANVAVTYLLPGGGTVEKTYWIDPLSRFSIWVDQEDPKLADTGVSTIVRSTNNVPIIVERAMWWPGNWTTWAEAHNSPGATETGTRWAVADGEVGGPQNSQTYVLIANTGAASGQAKVTVMLESGAPVSKLVTLPANSRTNVDIGYTFPELRNARFGVVIESLGTTPAPLVVERAIYTDAGGVSWAAGTNALATKLP